MILFWNFSRVPHIASTMSNQLYDWVIYIPVGGWWLGRTFSTL